MQKLSSLSGWPPQGGGGPFDTRKKAFLNSPELVTLRRVNRIVGARLDLTCIFGKEVVTFRFFASNEGVAESVAGVLGRNMGRNLSELGMLNVADGE